MIRKNQELRLGKKPKVNILNRAYISACLFMATTAPCFASAANPAKAIATGWVLPVLSWVLIIMAGVLFIKNVLSRNIGGIVSGLLIALIGIFFASKPTALITLANAIGGAFGL